jgi:hypothetical protein
MGSNYKVAGVSCGPHPEYGSMCVLALAGGFKDVAANPGGGAVKTGSSSKTEAPKTSLSVATPANSNNAPAKVTNTSNTNKSKPREF